jgi:oligoendopeptidase F
MAVQESDISEDDMAEERLRKRSEVPVEYTWKLEDLFETDQAWMEEYEALGSVPEKAAAFRGRLNNAKDLLEFFRLQDEIGLRLEKLFVYSSCRSDEDTGNNHYQDMAGKARSVYVAIMGAASFSGPEIMAIPDEDLERFYKEEPELETYRRSIYGIRRMKAHMLSAESERILALAGEMSASPDNIGSVLRNLEIRFPDVIDRDGNSRQMTEDNITRLLEDPDVDFRRRAFKTYYEKFSELKNTFATTLDAQYKQLMFFSRSRNYSSTLESALDANEVPTEVYTNLIEAVHRNLDKMYRYVALRKKIRDWTSFTCTTFILR